MADSWRLKAFIMLSLSDVTQIVNQLLPEPHAGLLNGILFGVKAQLGPDLKDALIRTGTLHIVALSGMNITILASLTATTLLRVFSRRITSLLTILIIMGFVWFVGMSPSVVRAAIMGILSLLSTVFGRQKGALWLLFCTGVLMLLYRPSYLTDLSFQLSFGATLGIILFGNVSPQASRIHAPVRRLDLFIWNLIKDDLKTTLAAQIFTTPLLMVTFHRFSLLSPVANVFIGWVIQPIMVVGFLVCLGGLLALPLAIPFAWVCWLLLQYVIVVIFTVSAIPFASFEW